MGWVFHESFKTLKSAQKTADSVVELKFAKGVKITKTGKKSKPYMMYILPIKEREEK
jgi:hypothetical protein